MCSVHICIGELVRVTKAKIDVRLSSEVEDGVNMVLAKHSFHICRGCDITLLEREVWATVENARVVECRTVIELVERHNIVMLRIRER